MSSPSALYIHTLFEVDEKLIETLGLVQEEGTVPGSTLDEILALDEGTDVEGVAL